MIGVLSLDPEGTILAARVTPDRDDLVGKRLSSVWNHESMSTHALLGVAMSGAGLSINVTVHDADGFPLDRTVTFQQTGRSDAPFWAVVSAHTSPDRDAASSKATSTIGATDGARSADESGVVDADKTDPSNASPGYTSPSSLVGGRHVSAWDEFESGASGEPGCRMDVSEPGTTSSHDDPSARSADTQLNNLATSSGEHTCPVATNEADCVDIYTALLLYLDNLKAENQSPVEITQKRLNVTWFIDTCGWATLSDISTVDITKAKTQLAGRSSVTIGKYIRRLKLFLEFCVDQGWIETNPAEAVKLPRAVRGEGVRALSTAEVDAIVDAVPSKYVERKAYYLVAAWTGLRREECVRLKWKNVDLTGENPCLNLTPDVTKNKKSARVPLNQIACGALASLRPPQPSPDVKVFERVPCIRTFDRDLSIAGVPKHDERGRAAGLHSFRKHLATWLERQGVDPTVIQSIMRHAKLEITRQSYMDDRLMDLAVRGSDALNAEPIEPDYFEDEYEDYDELEGADSTNNSTFYGITIEYALAAYIRDLELESQHHVEILCKRQNVKWFAAQAGWTYVTDIKTASINDAKAGLAGKASATIRKYLIRLSGFLDFCVAQEWIETNPSKNVKKPRHVKQEGVRALSLDELNALLDAVPPGQPDRRAFYTVLAWTGLRYGESRRLEWRHVNLNSNTPCLNLTPDITKNKKSDRIPLNQQAHRALFQLRPQSPRPDDNVFESMVTLRTFDRDLERAGIAKSDDRGRAAGIHSLRKFLATYLRAKRVDPSVVKAVMRHSKLEITDDIYSDYELMGVQEQAVAALKFEEPSREARVELGDAAEAGEAEGFRLKLAEG
ncbi:MAG: hypothetical protein Phyf2KO_00780 [Phycisphaerales bacterium]